MARMEARWRSGQHWARQYLNDKSARAHHQGGAVEGCGNLLRHKNPGEGRDLGYGTLRRNLGGFRVFNEGTCQVAPLLRLHTLPIHTRGAQCPIVLATYFMGVADSLSIASFQGSVRNFARPDSTDKHCKRQSRQRSYPSPKLVKVCYQRACGRPVCRTRCFAEGQASYDARGLCQQGDVYRRLVRTLGSVHDMPLPQAR